MVGKFGWLVLDEGSIPLHLLGSSEVYQSRGCNVKTARQAGWSLACDVKDNGEGLFVADFVSLYSDFGDYLEVSLHEGEVVMTYGNYNLFDCPTSVVKLVYLWLDVAFIVGVDGLFVN